MRLRRVTLPRGSGRVGCVIAKLAARPGRCPCEHLAGHAVSDRMAVRSTSAGRAQSTRATTRRSRRARSATRDRRRPVRASGSRRPAGPPQRFGTRITGEVIVRAVAQQQAHARRRGSVVDATGSAAFLAVDACARASCPPAVPRSRRPRSSIVPPSRSVDSSTSTCGTAVPGRSRGRLRRQQRVPPRATATAGLAVCGRAAVPRCRAPAWSLLDARAPPRPSVRCLRLQRRAARTALRLARPLVGLEQRSGGSRGRARRACFRAATKARGAAARVLDSRWPPRRACRRRAPRRSARLCRASTLRLARAARDRAGCSSAAARPSPRTPAQRARRRRRRVERPRVELVVRALDAGVGSGRASPSSRASRRRCRCGNASPSCPPGRAAQHPGAFAPRSRAAAARRAASLRGRAATFAHRALSSASGTCASRRLVGRAGARAAPRDARSSRRLASAGTASTRRQLATAATATSSPAPRSDHRTRSISSRPGTEAAPMLDARC